MAWGSWRGGGVAAAHARELPRVCYSTFFQTQTAAAVPTTAVPTEHGYGGHRGARAHAHIHPGVPPM